MLTGQLLVEDLRAVRTTEIIVLAADAGTHGVRSRNIGVAHGILDHVIMPRTPTVWERRFAELL